jgi:hypothetical protein
MLRLWNYDLIHKTQIHRLRNMYSFNYHSALIGAYICLRALSWHLGAFPNELLFPQQYQLGLKGVVAWQFYLYVVALLILTISSSALQFWLFKKKMQKNRKNVDIEEHFNNMGGN